MHERAAITSGLSALLAESGGAVDRVVAEIDPGVDPEVVAGIWDEMMADTGAELKLEEVLDLLRCMTCGADYRGTKLDPCPECRGDGLVIERAPEFLVRSWIGSG